MFFLETKNNLEQKMGIRFFNFIIYLFKIMLEKMTFLEKYQKLQLSIELSKKPKYKPKNWNSA